MNQVPQALVPVRARRPLTRWTAAAVLAAVTLLAGCAGTVKHVGPVAAAPAVAIQGVSQVSVQLSPDATRQLADNPQFNREELAGFMRRRLEGRGMLGTQATHRIDVVVTDIRVRSAFAAVMLGFMAGDDHVNGRVRLLDPAGKPVRDIEVTASYALGGWGGGQDGTRMNWLYDKFAELAVTELQAVVSAAAPGTAPASAVASAAPASAATATATPGVQAAAATARPAVASVTVPATARQPSGFAALNDDKALPVRGDRNREIYRDWLTRKPPRAFVVSEGDHVYSTWGSNPRDPMAPRDALERALYNCAQAGRTQCAVYAVDEQVTYRPATPTAAAQ